MDSDNLKIVVPKGTLGVSNSDTNLESALRAIAVFVEPNDKEAAWPEKYGVDFENDTFSMHTFCWCENDDCNYCGEKHYPNFEYKPTGFKVWWYKYIGRSTETSRQIDNKELKEILDACLNSLK